MTINENTIFEAAYDNDVNLIVKCINQYKIDPNFIHPRSGHTPLQAACETNAVDAIEELLKQGANPNLRFTKVSRIDGHIICADSVALIHVESIQAASLLIKYGAIVDISDKEGLTPIAWAAQLGNTELVEYLKEHHDR